MKNLKTSTALVLLTSAFALTGCNSAKTATNALEFCNTQYADSNKLSTTLLNVQWPEGSSPVADSLRRYVKQNLDSIAFYWTVNDEGGRLTVPGIAKAKSDSSVTTLYGKAMQNRMAENNRKMQREFPTYSKAPYYLNADVSMLKADNFVTVVSHLENYTGGAHGMHSTYGVSFNLTTGARAAVVIDTTQTAALQPIIKRELLKFFSKQMGTDTLTENTMMDFLMLGDSKYVPLPANQPYFTANGIVFDYVPYEIAPYAAGEITFTVPFSDLKPYLTPAAQQLVK